VIKVNFSSSDDRIEILVNFEINFEDQGFRFKDQNISANVNFTLDDTTFDESNIFANGICFSLNINANAFDKIRAQFTLKQKLWAH
jgi:hypothetical protein